ncbi:MAG: tRNA 2-thiocytidine(32) synthetase TtcA [Polyangiaceae bacterium]|nr:tRNA 2-thiocytidine(32) synthetase TtcA [Polyangiaceae bacterium]
MQSVAERLEKGLIARVARASIDFDLLERGDRVLVAVSGGKDSLCLLALLRQLRRRTPFSFSLAAITVDQGQPGFERDKLAAYFEAERIDYQVVIEDTYSVVQQKSPLGTIACSLCSRLRRGILYTAAVRLGATKIALGHHRDDAVETLLLNIFYSGQLKAMPAKLRADDGRNTVIRPLIYCTERDLAEYASSRRFPVVARSACTRQPDLKRGAMKDLIAHLQATNPHVRGNLFAALRHVRVTHLLDGRLLGERASEEPGDEAPEELPTLATVPRREQRVLGTARLWTESAPAVGRQSP